MRNIELKARLRDVEAARRIAASLATECLGAERQTDTYFHCRQGRLKLREIDGGESQLVWYARPDRQGPKPSDYLLAPVGQPEALRTALAAALGVWAVVRKRREIFLVDNVRVHLDEVDRLGCFLEFEAVLGPEIDDAGGQAQLARLAKAFSLPDADLLSGSYAEMIQRLP